MWIFKQNINLYLFSIGEILPFYRSFFFSLQKVILWPAVYRPFPNSFEQKHQLEACGDKLHVRNCPTN